MTVDEMKARLAALGWTLTGPVKTPGGYKAMATKGPLCALVAGTTEAGVLEDLVGMAEDRARRTS